MAASTAPPSEYRPYIIAAQVSLNPKSVLGLATGSTPIGTYRHLVEWYQKGELEVGGLTPKEPPICAGRPDHGRSAFFLRRCGDFCKFQRF